LFNNQKKKNPKPNMINVNLFDCMLKELISVSEEVKLIKLITHRPPLPSSPFNGQQQSLPSQQTLFSFKGCCSRTPFIFGLIYFARLPTSLRPNSPPNSRTQSPERFPTFFSSRNGI
jgi:hypothetical protein